MPGKQHSLLTLTTTLLFTLTAQSSFAFTITYTSQPTPVDYYVTPAGNQGYTWIPWISKLDLGGTLGLRRLLKNSFPDYKFEKASRDLAGKFNINQWGTIRKPRIINR
jgi:hypothetical protein